MYLCPETRKEERIMKYYPWQHRAPRKYLGTPQWSLDKLYISPFTAKRRYDEDGEVHYDKIERNMHPSGINLLDHYVRWLTEGKDDLTEFCDIYGLRDEDWYVFLFILTGMDGKEFRLAYQLRLADDLMRYTDMPFREVGARSGIGSHTNLCVVLRKQYGQTPTQRRKMLRQKHDLERFVL